MRKSGGDEEEKDEDEEDVVSALMIGRTRFLGGGAAETGRLASPSIAGSQRHFRMEEWQLLIIEKKMKLPKLIQLEKIKVFSPYPWRRTEIQHQVNSEGLRQHSLI